MSSEIFYKKAFIKVQDLFIPLVCQGSNNTWDISWNGREIPEKNWFVLNYPYKGQILFSETAIRDIAATYRQICEESGGGIKKSRYTPFKPEEFERWILAGMKSARTIEEYIRYGNCLYLTDYDTSMRIPIRSENELLEILPKYTGRPALQLRFFGRDIYLPKMKRQIIDFSKMERYYVLKIDMGYLLKLNSKKIFYVSDKKCGKKFTTEKKAYDYLKRNERRLLRFNCCIQSVEN